MTIRNITRDTAIHYAEEIIKYGEYELNHHCLNVGCDNSCDFDQSCMCELIGTLNRFLKRENYNKEKTLNETKTDTETERTSKGSDNTLVD